MGTLPSCSRACITNELGNVPGPNPGASRQAINAMLLIDIYEKVVTMRMAQTQEQAHDVTQAGHGLGLCQACPLSRR